MKEYEKNRSEQESWRKAMKKAWRAGDAEKVLRLMAQNAGDGGDVEKLIESFSWEVEVPLPSWREV